MTSNKIKNIVSKAAVVCATALAWLSGFFVMQIVYDSIVAAIIFATVWAIIVLCECRFSYISLKSDGSIRITKEEIKNNTWHILAAILIAMLVTIPLLLQIYSNEITSLNAASVHNLALQLHLLANLFSAHWLPMSLIALLVIAVFQLPIVLRMTSESESTPSN